MLTWLSYSEDTHSTGYLQIQSNTDGPPQGVTFYQSMMVYCSLATHRSRQQQVVAGACYF